MSRDTWALLGKYGRIKALVPLKKNEYFIFSEEKVLMLLLLTYLLALDTIRSQFSPRKQKIDTEVFAIPATIGSCSCAPTVNA